MFRKKSLSYPSKREKKQGGAITIRWILSLSNPNKREEMRWILSLSHPIKREKQCPIVERVILKEVFHKKIDILNSSIVIVIILVVCILF